ncbi:MAG TPA: ABC transporter ATP-binding protein [Stellaceae bacterium]|nr:ABC transporter ATP-binding protein [Stellaceae bacterium]
MNDLVINATGLRKRYGSVAAVDGIDLAIRRGEIFGLLGPNGAGKTTTLLMLLGLTEVSEGTIEVGGFDPAHDPLEVKRRIGYLPDSVGFYDNLTAKQNLRYTGRLAGFPRAQLDKRIAEGLDRVGLADVGDHRVGTYSRGMKQRLGLAEVLMKGAEVAILDEPTSGLDPEATFELLEMIRTMKADGTAVLISSHLLDRVQAVCDRVALFNAGKIVLQGTVPELAQRVLGGGYIYEVEADGGEIEHLLAAVPGARQVTRTFLGFRILADRDIRGDLARAVVASGAALLKLADQEPSLDTVYRHYFESHPHGLESHAHGTA